MHTKFSPLAKYVRRSVIYLFSLKYARLFSRSSLRRLRAGVRRLCWCARMQEKRALTKNRVQLNKRSVRTACCAVSGSSKNYKHFPISLINSIICNNASGIFVRLLTPSMPIMQHFTEQFLAHTFFPNRLLQFHLILWAACAISTYLHNAHFRFEMMENHWITDKSVWSSRHLAHVNHWPMINQCITTASFAVCKRTHKRPITHSSLWMHREKFRFIHFACCLFSPSVKNQAMNHSTEMECHWNQSIWVIVVGLWLPYCWLKEKYTFVTNKTIAFVVDETFLLLMNCRSLILTLNPKNARCT